MMTNIDSVSVWFSPTRSKKKNGFKNRGICRNEALPSGGLKMCLDVFPLWCHRQLMFLREQTHCETTTTPSVE